MLSRLLQKSVSGFSVPFKSTLPALLVIGFASVATTNLSHAQSSDVQALLDRMNRLEADLNNVQRKVYQGQDIAAPSSSSSTVTSNLGGNEAAAVLSARIDALEEEQRRVTGFTEEVNFRIDQIKSRLDKLVLDIDFRLTEIERKIGGGGASSAVVGTAAPNAVQQQSLPTTGQATDVSAAAANSRVVEGGELPKGTQLLGTIPAQGSADQATAAVTQQAAPKTDAEALQNMAALQNKSPAEQYNTAMTLIRKDDYAGAEAAFIGFLENNATHSLAGNAQYWLGETYYVRGDYNNAASAFLNGYQNYPDNSKAADNLLKLGMTLGRMEQTEEACAAFQQLGKQFSKLPSRLKRVSDREKQKFNCR